LKIDEKNGKSPVGLSVGFGTLISQSPTVSSYFIDIQYFALPNFKEYSYLCRQNN
jgi:hypothetical protein